jgi:hypothetical protein
MIGKNSGIRSMGERTHSNAITTAILALRGTRGSRRSRRAVVAQAGSTVARSFAAPAGRRRARNVRSAHVATSRPHAMRTSRRAVATHADCYGRPSPVRSVAQNDPTRDRQFWRGMSPPIGILGMLRDLRTEIEPSGRAQSFSQCPILVACAAARSDGAPDRLVLPRSWAHRCRRESRDRADREGGPHSWDRRPSSGRHSSPPHRRASLATSDTTVGATDPVVVTRHQTPGGWH